MELWRAKIRNGGKDTAHEKRVIIATENGMILSHVVQTKLEEPVVIDGQPTEWSPVKELAGKFFMMTGGFTTHGVVPETVPIPFMEAVAPFQQEIHFTRFARSDVGQLANVMMAPMTTFVNRTWIGTELEKHIVAEFVDRAIEHFPTHFIVQLIDSMRAANAAPLLVPKLADEPIIQPESPLV